MLHLSASLTFVRNNFSKHGAGPLPARALGAVLALLVVAAPSAAHAQQREMLNRLVQAAGASDAAMKAFIEGRGLIDAENWARAAERFNRFIADYPGDKNVDAAYYWLAFALSKQNKKSEADGYLVRLVNQYPRSTWVDDARKMRVELGVDPQIRERAAADANDEIKIIALQSLCQAEPARCASLVNDVLRAGSSSSLRLREAAISLLGRHGGAEAVPGLINIARNDANEKLRMRAISALGHSDDERALEPLREIALRPGYKDESDIDTAIHALVQHDSPRAVAIVGEVARTSPSPEARKHAIGLLSSRKGEPVVDELFKIYDAEQNIEIKKTVISSLANRLSPRAHDKLVE
ncbi:MAG: HEAT repeat domain-containing protein, partial [Pyrinomonadaceae bacterium]